jgi:hypothetical protein
MSIFSHINIGRSSISAAITRPDIGMIRTRVVPFAIALHIRVPTMMPPTGWLGLYPTVGFPFPRAFTPVFTQLLTKIITIVATAATSEIFVVRSWSAINKRRTAIIAVVVRVVLWTRPSHTVTWSHWFVVHFTPGSHGRGRGGFIAPSLTLAGIDEVVVEKYLTFTAGIVNLRKKFIIITFCAPKRK